MHDRPPKDLAGIVGSLIFATIVVLVLLKGPRLRRRSGKPDRRTHDLQEPYYCACPMRVITFLPPCSS
jgi:hypothetical protein